MPALRQAIRVQRGSYRRARLGLARKAPIRRTISGRCGADWRRRTTVRYAQAGHQSSHLPPSPQLDWALLPELPAPGHSVRVRWLAFRWLNHLVRVRHRSPHHAHSAVGIGSAHRPGGIKRGRAPSGAAQIEPGCPKRDRSVAPDAGGGSAERDRPRASRRSAVPLPHPEISRDGRPGRTGEQPHCYRVERLTNYCEIAAHNATCGITGDGTNRPGPQGLPRSAVGASPIAGRPIGFRPLALLQDEPGLQEPRYSLLGNVPAAATWKDYGHRECAEKEPAISGRS